jgi:uncharacterized protein
MSAPAFIQAQGQGRHGWPRTLGTLALAAGGGAAGVLLARTYALPWMQTALADSPEPVRSAALALMAGAIFACVLLGLFAGVRLLHRRPVRSVLTAAPRFRTRQLVLGFLVSAALVAGLGFALDPSGVKTFDAIPAQTLAMVAAAMLAGFLIQASAEEILFRGYMPQIGWRIGRSLWMALLPGIGLFTLAHLGYNIESALFSLITAIGLTAVVMVLDGLELAMGAHIGNNFVVALLFQDLSDANAPSASGIDWAELGANAAVMLALILVALVLRSRSRRTLSPSAT